MDRTALMDASEAGRLEVVVLLLNNGADPNARDVNGNTAMKRANKRCAEEIVGLLKAHGAKE